MALAYSGNLQTALPSVSYDSARGVPKYPWKHAEWGNTRTHLFTGNLGAGGVAGDGSPFNPSIVGVSQSACNALVAAATVTVGTLECNSSGGIVIHSAFNRTTDWPLGTWACVRGHIKGTNTDSGELHIYFNGTTIFSATNLRWASTLVETSFDKFVWNNYANGNGGAAQYEALEAYYRYEDNFVVTAGAPKSCAEIGMP
jgi:hypothetical protein